MRCACCGEVALLEWKLYTNMFSSAESGRQACSNVNKIVGGKEHPDEYKFLREGGCLSAKEPYRLGSLLLNTAWLRRNGARGAQRIRKLVHVPQTRSLISRFQRLLRVRTIVSVKSIQTTHTRRNLTCCILEENHGLAASEARGNYTN